MSDPKDLRTLVRDALNNALNGGYEQHVLHDPVEQVAIDLLDYDYAIWELKMQDGEGEAVEVMDLIPLIEEYRADVEKVRSHPCDCQ